MSDLKQTSDGDLAFTNGSLTLVSGADEVRQRITQRLRTGLGECFLDNGIGVPYLQDILRKNPNPTVVRSRLVSELLNTPGVKELLSFSVDVAPNTRSATVTFKAKAKDGSIINGSVSV